jgi:hypothetical protein
MYRDITSKIYREDGLVKTSQKNRYINFKDVETKGRFQGITKYFWISNFLFFIF